jgi:hypothetical protein
VGEDAGMYTLTVGPMAVRRILVRSTDVADAQTLIGDAQVGGQLPVDEEPDEPAPDRALGFSSFVLVAVAVVIVVGIVLAYMPGSG